MNELSVTEARREDATKTARPDSYTGTSPIKVNKIGHLVYEVSDIERSARFWTEVMGFVETDRNEIGMVFFRCAADHHAGGRNGVEDGASGARRGQHRHPVPGEGLS